MVANGSIDSTISIWNSCRQKPVTVVLDVFKMGISDMCWGFNGNILLMSSNDGMISLLHFKPGFLGIPISEMEKQQRLEKLYGSRVVDEYKKFQTVKDTSSQFEQYYNQQARGQGAIDTQKSEKIEKNGKKIIKPIMTKQYDPT